MSSERPPVIGVMSRITPFFHEGRPYPRAGVALGYLEAVQLSGGTPIILPMTQDRAVLEAAYALCDGILLPGGSDVSPLHYGEEPHVKLDTVDPLRDQTEIYLCQRALHDDMPILAICRGLQVMNVAAGGTLYQDIHAQLDENCLRHFQSFTVEWASHSIQVHEDTLLRSVIGEAEVMVNSYHHQAVKDVAKDFKVSAVAKDGVIEGLESPNHSFALGVQWHPELMHTQRDFNLALFRRHIEASALYARGKTTADT